MYITNPGLNFDNNDYLQRYVVEIQLLRLTTFKTKVKLRCEICQRFPHNFKENPTVYINSKDDKDN